MQIIWKIFSWMIVLMVNIGQYKNMEESSELTRSSGNINRDGNQQCIKYEKEELIGIASKCMQDNRYRILNRETCVKIRYFRLNRRYRRGGKKRNIACRKLTQRHNSLNIDNLVSINFMTGVQIEIGIVITC